jgi:hypothetical protein
MDKAGVAATVLYPTVGLTYFSPDVKFDAALVRSYNTWLAERCSHAPDRLKWGAIIPMRGVPDAVAEVKRAKGLSATAAYIESHRCRRSCGRVGRYLGASRSGLFRAAADSGAVTG